MQKQLGNLEEIAKVLDKVQLELDDKDKRSSIAHELYDARCLLEDTREDLKKHSS